ncbi:extracellular solute-binding protein [Paenibacillus sp. FA6]|uniref:ABC transporter substrate-binding protein n=1 Tax=Paenibacillus sp. FA6 TaxID=3413029 RepID=UPI003F65D7AC
MARPTQTEFNQRIQHLIVQLRDQIYNGWIQPNEYLPSELRLGKQYHLNKESVRRALDGLVKEGLITKVRRVGNQVNDPSMWLRGSNRSEASEHCGSSGMTTIEYGQTTLRFAYHPSLLNEANLQQLVDSFEDTHSGVRVQMMPTAFPIEYADHGLADVVTVTSWDTMKRRNHSHSARLSHLTSAPYDDAASPKLNIPFLDPHSSNNQRLIATPFLFSPLVLCYNRAHFVECGIEVPDGTWTWYTLLNAVRKLTSRLDVWGFATHIQSINRWPIFLLQNGFHFRPDEPGKRVIDDPALWEGLRIARDLIHKQGRPISLWTEDNSDTEQLFLEGNASIILTTYFGLNRMYNSSLDYALAPLPIITNSDTLLLVTGLSVHRHSPQQDLANQFVNYLSSFEAQSHIRRQTLSLPAHAKALSLTDGLLGNRPQNEDVYMSMWPHCRQYSDLGLDADMIEAVRLQLKGYWSRMEDEAEVSARLEMLLR